MDGSEVPDGIVAGSVKWFDDRKGFGFVVADGGGSDILLHVNVLKVFGQSSILDGTRLHFRTTTSARGVQVASIVSIESGNDGWSEEGGQASRSEPGSLSKLPLEPARVKWFDRNKGFGFANVFGRSEDVFIHIDVLRACGLVTLQAGEAICLRATESERSRTTVQVAPWDAGTKVPKP